MKESKEPVETLFRIRDDKGNILAESDTMIDMLMKLSALDDEDNDEEECCGRCCECELDSCCDEDEDEDDENDVCDSFHEPDEVEVFRVEVTPAKILRAVGIVGGLIALRRLWKRMKG